MKTAIILANVGTPDKPELKAVRRYLQQFLNDPRVIDLPWLWRKILVNLIIVPFRAPKSTRLYQMLWGANGSPLFHYSLQIRDKIQKMVPENCEVFTAMRYGNPSLQIVIDSLEGKNYDRIIILPMFPQYASSTTGTINELVMQRIKKWNIIPNLVFINQFYEQPDFIKAFIAKANTYQHDKFDHVLFSFHGLPLRHIQQCHPEIKLDNCKCTLAMPAHGGWCYKAQCYQTARLIASELKLEPDQFSVGFQSRLSKNWLQPFSDKLITEKAKQGLKSLLVIAPSFVADCLETELEIGMEYKQLFLEHGGQHFEMVESLNDSNEWALAIKNILLKYL